MNPYETYQQNPTHQWSGQSSGFNPQQLASQLYGQNQNLPGQAAFGQQSFGQGWGQPNFNYGGGYGGQSWGQQRQLSHHEVGEVVRQLLPMLPQILAQAQLPQSGIGYGAYGQTSRTLTQQDVIEVARHILSIAPQLASMSQSPWQTGQFGGSSQSFPQQSYGMPFQSAFGSAWGQQRY